jgi:hypothetical protein
MHATRLVHLVRLVLISLNIFDKKLQTLHTYLSSCQKADWHVVNTHNLLINF